METARLSSIHWHDERFAYDCDARNQQVEQACFHHFFGKKEMTIVDLGAGAGSNCLYFFEKFPSQQKWIFIETEEQVSKYAFKRLTQEATGKGYSTLEKDNRLTLKKEERSIEIEYITASFLDLVDLVDLDKVDLVMASAVFDLISFPQFVSIGSVLLEKKLPLLTTLNYAEMNFNAEVEFGSSIWKLEGSPAKSMNTHLLNFMEAATNQMMEEEEEKTLFEKWITTKRNATEEGTLNTYVQYYDLFMSNEK